MSATYVGETEFDDMCEPSFSKNEYGIDVMNRKLKGAAYRLKDFLDSLNQGATFNGWPGFYLQTWQADQDPVYPEVVLTYKGLIGGNDTNPIGDDEMTLQSTTVSVSDPEEASRDITYEALTTTYRYATKTRPQNARMTGPSYERSPIIRSSVVRGADGTIYHGNVPAALLTALTPATGNVLLGLRGTAMAGTPLFEVEEIWATLFSS